MRLIDADALKERAIRVSTVKEHCYFKAVGTREIDKAPTIDAVPVVRCGECKHSIMDGWVCGGPNFAMVSHATYPGEFCSYGERRTDG